MLRTVRVNPYQKVLTCQVNIAPFKSKKSFQFNSCDNYIRQILLQHGWKQTESPNCTLKWINQPNSQIHATLQESSSINHFEESHCLTTKFGLNTTFQCNSFITDKGTNAFSFYPRTYDLNRQYKSFLQDFKRTAALNLVKKIMIHIEITNPKLFKRLNANILKCKHESNTQQIQYTLFSLLQYKKIFSLQPLDTIQINGKLFLLILKYLNNILSVNSIQVLSQQQLDYIVKMSELNPPYQQRDCWVSFDGLQVFFRYYKKLCRECKWFLADGLSNIWVVKASQSSRGRSIFLVQDVKSVQMYNNGMRIIQKYIQNVWIHRGDDAMQHLKDKKFDVRIWVLVKSISPLQVYIYREGYLRISQQPYQLNTLSNDTHLTNFSINWKHSQNQSQSYVLLSQFQTYLQQQGLKKKGQLLNEIKAIVVHTMQCASLTMKQESSNCFELFGFDIILDNQLKPWLLEVNMSPACKGRGELKKVAKEMGEGLLTILNFIDGCRYQWQTLLSPLPLLKNHRQITQIQNTQYCLPGIHNKSFYSFKQYSEQDKKILCCKKQNDVQVSLLNIKGQKCNLKIVKLTEELHLFIQSIIKIQRMIRQKLLKGNNQQQIKCKKPNCLLIIQILARLLKKNKRLSYKRIRRMAKIRLSDLSNRK